MHVAYTSDQHRVTGKNNMMEKSDLHGGNQEHGLTNERTMTEDGSYLGGVTR